jgi:hypothetical protein
VVVDRRSGAAVKATVDRRGRAYVYVADYDRSVTVVRRGGQGWSRPRTLIGPAKGGVPDIVSLDADGNARGDQVIVVSDDTRVWARTRRGGEPWTRPAEVGGGGSPAVTTDGTGRATVAFSNAAAGGAASVIRDSARGVWSQPRVLARSGSPARDLTASADRFGAVVVAWVQRAKDGSGPVLAASHRPAAGTFGAPARLSARDIRGLRWVASALHGGQASIAWISKSAEKGRGTWRVRLRQTAGAARHHAAARCSRSRAASI